MDESYNTKKNMSKKSIFTIALCFLGISNAFSQKIENGSKWWDGYALWTATCDGSSVVMNGELPNGDMDFFQIYKLDDKNEYAFTSDRPYFNRFNADLSCRLKYIRQEGMYFIAVKNKKDETVWIFVLTPDNLENCVAQQKALEEELPSDILCTALLNTAYLNKFPKKELRLMRNEILARHGYRFQSKDLQEWFGDMPWYKPAKNNNSIRLNIIEKTNVELMKCIEAQK